MKLCTPININYVKFYCFVVCFINLCLYINGESNKMVSHYKKFYLLTLIIKPCL